MEMETLGGKAKWMGGISRRSGMDTKILIKIGTAGLGGVVKIGQQREGGKPK
jgi:hypothetical protein